MRPLYDCIKKDKKEEVNNKCKYCEDKIDRYYKSLTTTAEYSGLEISLHPKGTLRVRAYLGDVLFKAQDIVNVKYCPMCGRKLGE